MWRHVQLQHTFSMSLQALIHAILLMIMELAKKTDVVTCSNKWVQESCNDLVNTADVIEHNHTLAAVRDNAN